MRVKTKDRRQAIIDVAITLFKEVGYERASMAAISHRVGGSKATLYSYFQSKEELFETAMRASVVPPGVQILELLQTEPNDLHLVLKRFSDAYLGFVLSKEVLAFCRTAISEGASSSLGQHLFEQGPQRVVATLAEFFKEQMKLGRLRKAPALTLALHFKGLVETGFLEPALYGAQASSKKREAIASAVDAFLRAYDPRE